MVNGSYDYYKTSSIAVCISDENCSVAFFHLKAMQKKLAQGESDFYPLHIREQKYGSLYALLQEFNVFYKALILLHIDYKCLNFQNGQNKTYKGFSKPNLDWR